MRRGQPLLRGDQWAEQDHHAFPLRWDEPSSMRGAFSSLSAGPSSARFSPANWQDRDVALALGLAVDGGIAFADLGYRRAELADLLAEEADLLLLTPADVGDHRAPISSLRERIDTSFRQLWNRFADRVFSRFFVGLWNTTKLKMLHYNLCHAGLIPV